jgi:hypothetical protein
MANAGRTGYLLIGRTSNYYIFITISFSAQIYTIYTLPSTTSEAMFFVFAGKVELSRYFKPFNSSIIISYIFSRVNTPQFEECSFIRTNMMLFSVFGKIRHEHQYIVPRASRCYYNRYSTCPDMNMQWCGA